MNKVSQLLLEEASLTQRLDGSLKSFFKLLQNLMQRQIPGHAKGRVNVGSLTINHFGVLLSAED